MMRKVEIEGEDPRTTRRRRLHGEEGGYMALRRRRLHGQNSQLRCQR
jgi:hypothetical protein